MIVGVSHITLSSKQIDEDVKKLQTIGYQQAFTEKNVPSFAGKNRFMTSSASLHSLAFCQHEKGIPIELVQYDHFSHQEFPLFEVLLDMPRSEHFVIKEDVGARVKSVWDEVFQGDAELNNWPPFDTSVWLDRSGKKQKGLYAVLVSVNNIKGAQHFWQSGLGFRCICSGKGKDGQEWAYLSFVSPVKNWVLGVILTQTFEDMKAVMLDDTGFNCLSLLSTNLEKDSARLHNMGVRECSGIFAISVGGKKLRIEIIRALNNELIELIEIKSFSNRNLKY
jgi:hypothetical protein